MLEIKHLTKYYGDILGVSDLSLKINKGEIFGFIGPNGAGKSTTIRCIMNLINKTSGEIYIDGVLDDKGNIKLKEDIGYLPSEIHLYDDLTAKEVFEYSQLFYKKDCSKRLKYLVKKLKIDISKKLEEMSMGNIKKVGIVLAMMHEPKLLILDEATSGLDPLMQEEFYELILEEKKKGTTIFFSSHILSELKRICDRVGIIKEGKLIKIQTIEELINNDLEIITIKSKDIDKIIKNIKIKVISKDKDVIKFMYTDDINKLLKVIGNYDIEKILIEDSSIEDIFIHYYK